MMNKSVLALLIAQFLSAFADNAILFIVIAIVMKQPDAPAWYIPALQGSFLVAFVIFAPWVGYWANRYPKSRLLTISNLIKASGAGLLLTTVEPMLAYAIVGAGAALYSPAKYGILPEITDRSSLVKINGWVEGSTILAILMGMLVGAKVADYAINIALAGSVVLYIGSALVTMALPKQHGVINKNKALPVFVADLKSFIISPRTRFTLIGTALFWSTAAVLRLIIIAWAPVVLQLNKVSDISLLTLFMAVGIMVGAAGASKLFSLENVRQVRFPAYLMAIFIVIFGFTTQIDMSRLSLFFIGVAGGLFIVPINAALQEEGHGSIGSGSAVALQNFVENLAMLIIVGGYTYALKYQPDPAMSIKVLGAITLSVTLIVVSFLPKIIAQKIK